jgi:hypothetical protein
LLNTILRSLAKNLTLWFGFELQSLCGGFVCVCVCCESSLLTEGVGEGCVDVVGKNV